MVKHTGSITRFVILGSTLCILYGTSQVVAQAIDVNHRRALTVEQWREDLRFLAQTLRERHVDPFHSISPEAFKDAVDALYERIPALDDTTIAIEFERIGALIGDGHTKVLSLYEFDYYPLGLYFFADGLFVQAAPWEYAPLVGGRIVRIGRLSAEEAYEKVRPLWGADNAWGARSYIPRHHLIRADVLYALGIAERPDEAVFVVEVDGTRHTVTLRPSLRGLFFSQWMPNEGAQADPDWVDMRGAGPPPLWLRDASNPYWYDYLADTQTLYVQFNTVVDKPDEPEAAFFNRVFDFVAANPVERFVLDVRLNGGGNHFLTIPIVTGLIRSKVNVPGKLFVVLGRASFSATQVFINELEKYTPAVFVGEPTGGRPHMFGDDVHVRLPHSNMLIRVSQIRWQSPWGLDPRSWTAPHIAAELTSEAYRNNRDPVLQAIYNYTPEVHPDAAYAAFAKNGDLDVFLSWYRTYRVDPGHKFFDGFWVGPARFFMSAEALMNGLGYQLMQQQRYADAVKVLQLNVEYYPDSANAHDSLGEAYQQAGDIERARWYYERSLELDPNNAHARAILEQLGRE